MLQLSVLISVRLGVFKYKYNVKYKMQIFLYHGCLNTKYSIWLVHSKVMSSNEIKFLRPQHMKEAGFSKIKTFINFSPSNPFVSNSYIPVGPNKLDIPLGDYSYCVMVFVYAVGECLEGEKYFKSETKHNHQCSTCCGPSWHYWWWLSWYLCHQSRPTWSKEQIHYGHRL